MKEDALFYVGQKAFIRTGDQILVLGDPKEGLDFPGGKIQEGEIDLAESLKREVREEVGLEISVGDPFGTWVFEFPADHRLAGKKVLLVAYSCDYVSGTVVLSNGHNSFTWVDKNSYTNVDDGTEFFAFLKKYFEQKHV